VTLTLTLWSQRPWCSSWLAKEEAVHVNHWKSKPTAWNGESSTKQHGSWSSTQAWCVELIHARSVISKSGRDTVLVDGYMYHLTEWTFLVAVLLLTLFNTGLVDHVIADANIDRSYYNLPSLMKTRDIVHLGFERDMAQANQKLLKSNVQNVIIYIVINFLWQNPLFLKIFLGNISGKTGMAPCDSWVGDGRLLRLQWRKFTWVASLCCNLVFRGYPWRNDDLISTKSTIKL
jgi:hypothetical protein